MESKRPRRIKEAAAAAEETASQWQHPASRIYRVSRASGGKDRHSKVYTSKGLRDRRVRLSVSTAIQFYDLQDRLGYDQPSKAIEWLIKAAAPAIDDLPSLESTFIPPPAAPKPEANSSASETSRGSVLSLSRSENRIKNRERARERAGKDNNNVNANNGSFTDLLTGGGDNVARVHTADYFGSNFGNYLQFGGMQQEQMFPLASAGGGGDEYNLNFSISSGFAGFHRGTLQSNTVPFLFGGASAGPDESQYAAAGLCHGYKHMELKGKEKG